MSSSLPSRRVIALVAVVAGLVALIGSPAPTGGRIVDSVIVAGAVAVTVWLGSRAPRLVTAWSALIAGVASMSWLGLALRGRHEFASGLRSPSLPAAPEAGESAGSPIDAVLVGITANVVVRSELDGFFGFSAVVGDRDLRRRGRRRTAPDLGPHSPADGVRGARPRRRCRDREFAAFGATAINAVDDVDHTRTSSSARACASWARPTSIRRRRRSTRPTRSSSVRTRG